MMHSLIKKVEAGSDLSRQEAELAMEEILSGSADEETIVALLAALRAKGETVAELVGFARAMRRQATPVLRMDRVPTKCWLIRAALVVIPRGRLTFRQLRRSWPQARASASRNTATARSHQGAVRRMFSKRWVFRLTFHRNGSARPFARSGLDFFTPPRCTRPCGTPCLRGDA